MIMAMPTSGFSVILKLTLHTVCGIQNFEVFSFNHFGDFRWLKILKWVICNSGYARLGDSLLYQG